MLLWRSASDTKLLYRLTSATDGIIANIMNIMRGTSWLARKRRAEKLEVDVLAVVFDKRRANQLDKTMNPFYVLGFSKN